MGSPSNIIYGLMVFCLIGMGGVSAEQEDGADDLGLFSLPLEEALKLTISSPATLTKTHSRLVPAAVTTIDEDMILSSGARSLNELLEVYIPGLQMIRHQYEVSHLGTRGIISDREDKVLMLVNGRVMNERTHFGALTERDLPLMADIHHVDVVRGPGSAIYGLGAVSMVINIVTHDSKTFQGVEGRTRAGFREEFYTQEFKYGHQWDEDSGVFLYGGISRYLGADTEDAPLKYSTSFDTRWGDYVNADQGVSFDVGRDGAQYRDQEPYKLHAEFNFGDLEIWTRYSRGGETGAIAIKNIAVPPIGRPVLAGFDPDDPYPVTEFGYQQATIFTKYHHEVNAEWDIDYILSYDMTDYERYIPVDSANAPRIESHREDEYLAKIVAHWTPSDVHSLAFGGEYSHEEFGLKSPGYPDQDPISFLYLSGLPRWSTDTYSGFFEHQWQIADKWTSFLGARLDKHTFSDPLFSPRAALIYMPNDKDTLKFIATRSQRMNFGEDLYSSSESGDSKPDPEVLDSFETRWERQYSKNLWSGVSLFYYDLEVIGYDSASRKSILVGEQSSCGIEFELSYIKDPLTLKLSHAYTELIDFDLNPGASTQITVAPYGYGNYLNNWSNHISKLTAKYKVTEKLDLNAAFQLYWGFPGIDDYTAYQNSKNAPDYYRDPYRDDIHGPNAYLDLGLDYHPSDNLTVILTGYNLLGIFDENLNKRNYLAGRSPYRIQSPALGVTLQYRF